MDRGRLARSTASRVKWIALPTVTYATHNPPSRLYVYEWCVAWRCRGKRGPGYAEATTRRREPWNILLCRHPHFPHADTGWCSVRNDNVPEHHQVLDSANLPHYRHLWAAKCQPCHSFVEKLASVSLRGWYSPIFQIPLQIKNTSSMEVSLLA